jgi:hypothetical protein
VVCLCKQLEPLATIGTLEAILHKVIPFSGTLRHSKERRLIRICSVIARNVAQSAIGDIVASDLKSLFEIARLFDHVASIELDAMTASQKMLPNA